MKKLAEAAGVDTSNPAEVRRFDKKRPGRKTSNEEWQIRMIQMRRSGAPSEA